MPATPGADESTPLLADLTVAQYCTVPVYPLIHEIRLDIVAHIDTPLTYEQLVAPDSTYTIIRPLTDKYLLRRNPAVVFCLLLNKVQFTSDSNQISISTLSESRAQLCEILAIRVLRGWSERSLHLATVLLTPWHMYQGAPPAVIASVKNDGEEEILEHSGTAMEMAIISASKRFIRSPSCQKVIEGIWTGKIVYSSLSTHALIQDNYKQRPIQIYNPHKAPLLDHYRLKVPKVRAFLEYLNFVVLFVLYVVAIESINTQYINGPEIAFIIYAIAFSIDKLATIREHGLKVFYSSLVNGFDLGFVMIFAVYLGVRLFGAASGDQQALELGTEILAVGAVLMFPRFAFMTLADNLMILSIRSMLVEFFFLMTVGMFCFAGFGYALRVLGHDSAGTYPLSRIVWWLLEVFFGLDATGFEESPKIHPTLGPALMVVYAFLSNTLLVAVCVAVLGNTFSAINADAAAESMFRKAVATIEGVKADSVFSYQLPFNILAVLLLYPLSFVLNPRWFHKVNVLMIRATNLPVLLCIALYERHTYQQTTIWEQICDYTEHYVGKLTAATGFEGIVGARMDVSHVFEIEEEFGTAYKNWDEDDYEFEGECALLDDDEEDDSSDMGGSNDDLEEAKTPTTILQSGNGTTTMSPTTASYPSSPAHTGSSPVAPFVTVRRRQSSGPAVHHHVLPNVHGHPANSATVPHPPLAARVRRNSAVVGPSPLAQLFVRHAVDQMSSSIRDRRATLAVGSLPVTSSMQPPPPPCSGLPQHSSPGRHGRLSSLGGGSAAGAAPGAGLSASLSASSLASIERIVPKAAVRPSVTPIDECPTPPTPRTPEQQRRVPFPGLDSSPQASTTATALGTDSPRPTRVTFNEPPLRRRVVSGPKQSRASAPSVLALAETVISPTSTDPTPMSEPQSATTSTPTSTTSVLPSPTGGITLVLPEPSLPLSTNSVKSEGSEASDKGDKTDKTDKPERPQRPAPSPLKGVRSESSSTLPGSTASPRLRPMDPAGGSGGGGSGLRTPSDSKLRTASQLLETRESHRGSDGGSSSRIEEMAARQTRIEAMLEQLLAGQAEAAALAAAASRRGSAGDSGASSAGDVPGGVDIQTTPRRQATHDDFDDFVERERR